MRFHKLVLDSFYSPSKGFAQLPKCYILAHSFGCMQTFNALLRMQNVDEETGKSIYSAVCFQCPFFSFHANSVTKINMLYWYFRFALWRGGDDAFAPEVRVTPDMLQDF